MRNLASLVIAGSLLTGGGAGLYLLSDRDSGANEPAAADSPTHLPTALLAPPSPLDQEAALVSGIAFEPRPFRLSIDLPSSELEARIATLLQDETTERARLGHVLWRLLQEADDNSEQAWIVLLGLRELKPLHWADGLLSYIDRPELSPRMVVGVLDAIDQGFKNPQLSEYDETGTTDAARLRGRVLDYLDARILNMEDAPIEVYQKIVTLYPRYASGDDAAECIEEFLSRYEADAATSKLDGLELSEIAFTHAFLSAENLNTHLSPLLTRFSAWPVDVRAEVDQMLYVHLGGLGIDGAHSDTRLALRTYLDSAHPLAPTCPAELRGNVDRVLASL